MSHITLLFLLAAWAIPAGVPLAAAAAMNQKECIASGGTWNATNGTCSGKAETGAPAGKDAPQTQGITITGCVPSASGDPLKGLNVDKGGKNTGGSLCP